MKTKKDTQVRGVYAYPFQLLTAGAALLLSTTIAFGQATKPQDDTKKDDVVSLEKYEVTGSRIKRIDAETANPVISIKSDEIKMQGFPTIAEAVRSLSFNSGAYLTATDAGTTFTPGINTVNLRGLGNNQTLVLINGRRAAPYAKSGYDGGMLTMFDLNSIPEAAIESIEILKDGASAIYGSDAVAGVINFKLKRDYEGTTVSFLTGNYFDTDGLAVDVSAVVGVRSGKGSIFSAVGYSQRNSVFARDIHYTKDADKTSVADKASPHYRVENWQSTGADSEQELIDTIVSYWGTPTESGFFFDGRSSRGFPGYVDRPNSDPDDPTEPASWTYRTPVGINADPTVAVVGSNPYNFQETNGLFPEWKKYSIYTSAKYDFTSYLYGFADLSYLRTETKSYSAATPVDLEGENGWGPAGQLIIPAQVSWVDSTGAVQYGDNPANPWDEDLVSGRRRMVEQSNRINDVTSDNVRIVAGVGGEISYFPQWTWEAAVMYSKNTVTDIATGMSDSRLQQALYGLTKTSDGSLYWNPDTPAAEREFFNWFGYNSEAMTNYLTVRNPTISKLEYRAYDFSVTGPILEGLLPGGAIGVAFGAEHRAEKLQDIETETTIASDILGGGEAGSYSGQRSVTAFYAEVTLPVLKQLEVQLAGRYEDYSDRGFKDRIRPKIGLKARPLSWLAVRANYSQSFKAPDLAYLYTTTRSALTGGQVWDPVTLSSIDQLKVLLTGNPDLKPETTDTYYVGLIIEAPKKSFLKGLEFSLDWFRFEQSNVLGTLSDFYGYNEILTEAALGNPLFVDKVVRDPVTNRFIHLYDSYLNLFDVTYTGWDFGVSYLYETNRYGSFRISADATYVTSYKFDGGEEAGDGYIARVNGRVNLSWRFRDWDANLLGIYRGPRNRYIGIGSLFGADDFAYVQYKVKKQVTFNASVGYSGFKKMRLRVGLNNAFNQMPPTDPFESTGTTNGVNTVEPRYWYFSIERDF